MEQELTEAVCLFIDNDREELDRVVRQAAAVRATRGPGLAARRPLGAWLRGRYESLLRPRKMARGFFHADLLGGLLDVCLDGVDWDGPGGVAAHYLAKAEEALRVGGKP